MKSRFHHTSPLLFLLFILPLSIQAQDPWGAWSSVQINKSWSKIYVSFLAEYRSVDNFEAIDCYFLRPFVGYKFNSWFKADMAYDYTYKTASPQNRVLVSATGTLKRENLSVSLRERFVGAWTVSDGAFSPLLRSYLKTQYKIVCGSHFSLSPYMAIELYTWDKWKMSHHFVGCSIAYDKTHSLNIFYAYNLSAKKTHADNIIGVGYTIDL